MSESYRDYYLKLSNDEKVIFLRTLAQCRYEWIHSAWQWVDVSPRTGWRRSGNTNSTKA